MHIKKIFFPILGFIFLLSSARSWEGVESLNFNYNGQVINLDEHHKKLGGIEQTITYFLPDNDKENIVLVTVSFLSSEGILNTADICGGENKKPYIFESGWESSILNKPVLGETKKFIWDSHAKLKKDELKLEEEEEIIKSVMTLAKKQKALQAVLSEFYFENDFVQIKEILIQADKNLELSQEDSLIYKGFKISKENYEKENEGLTRIGEIAQNDLQSHINNLKENPENKLKELLQKGEKYKTAVHKQNKAIDQIGSSIIALYWHSEQKFLCYLREQMNFILGELKPAFSPEAVIINLHSRFDICDVCQHVLKVAYQEQDGVIFNFKKALYEKFNVKPEAPFGFTISFREKREKSTFKIGGKSITSLDDLTKILPIIHLNNENLTQ